MVAIQSGWLKPFSETSEIVIYLAMISLVIRRLV